MKRESGCIIYVHSSKATQGTFVTLFPPIYFVDLAVAYFY